MSNYIDHSKRPLKNDELDDNELDSVTGGLVTLSSIAILIGLRNPPLASPPPEAAPAKHWFNGG